MFTVTARTLSVIVLIAIYGAFRILDKTSQLSGDNAHIIKNDETSKLERESPFKMPLRGKRFEIFQPFYDMEPSKKMPPLLASPLDFVLAFKERIRWANSMVKKSRDVPRMTEHEHANSMYLEMLKSFVSAVVFDKAELSVRGKEAALLDKTARKKGDDWAYAGDTMTGLARLDNVEFLLKDVISNDVHGDYIETGVWRGGSSVFARAVMRILEPDTNRMSYVCDSFRGLPPGDRDLSPKDKGWDGHIYLEVDHEIVANNFIKYNLLDPGVIFVKGFFVDTMPILSNHIEKLSIMRLDGDMYESTVDVLYHLYDKLSIGGYVIMDDWNGFPSKDACEDFFEVHGIQPKIIQIDHLSAYWKKEEQVSIQYWRYEQSHFKLDAGSNKHDNFKSDGKRRISQKRKTEMRRGEN